MFHYVWKTPQYAKLSHRARALLVDLCLQYNGFNNGRLVTALVVMKQSGWRSKSLLQKAFTELEARGFIIRTRRGGINSTTLWALTFHGIDDCRDSEGKRKFDAGITPSPSPLHLWRTPEYDLPSKAPTRRVKKASASPSVGHRLPDSRSKGSETA